MISLATAITFTVSDVIKGAGSPNYLDDIWGGVHVDGDLVYVAATGDNAVSIFNISDKSNIFLVGNVTGSGSPNYLGSASGLFVENNLLYVASTGDDSLSIFNVTNPVSPVLLDSIQGAGSPNYLDAADDVVVRGDYAFVVSRTDNYLSSFNVSNASNIVLLDVITTGLDAPFDIDYEGEVAFVASSANAMVVAFNISNASNLVHLDSISSDGFNSLVNVRGVSVENNIVVAVAYSGSLNTINATNASNLQFLDYISHSGGCGVDLENGVAVATTYGQASDEVYFYDLSNASSIQLLGSVDHDDLDGSWAVFYNNSYAFVGTRTDDSLVAIEYSSANMSVDSITLNTTVQYNTQDLNWSYDVTLQSSSGSFFANVSYFVNETLKPWLNVTVMPVVNGTNWVTQPLLAGNLSVHDDVIVELLLFNASESAVLNSSVLTIPNRDPTISNISIIPSNVYNTTTLNASFYYADPDGDTYYSFLFNWRINGTSTGVLEYLDNSVCFANTTCYSPVLLLPNETQVDDLVSANIYGFNYLGGTFLSFNSSNYTVYLIDAFPDLIFPANIVKSQYSDETSTSYVTVNASGVGDLYGCNMSIVDADTSLGSYVTFNNSNFDLSSGDETDVLLTFTNVPTGSYSADVYVTCWDTVVNKADDLVSGSENDITLTSNTRPATGDPGGGGGGGAPAAKAKLTVSPDVIEVKSILGAKVKTILKVCNVHSEKVFIKLLTEDYFIGVRPAVEFDLDQDQCTDVAVYTSAPLTPGSWEGEVLVLADSAVDWKIPVHLKVREGSEIEALTAFFGGEQDTSVLFLAAGTFLYFILKKDNRKSNLLKWGKSSGSGFRLKNAPRGSGFRWRSN